MARNGCSVRFWGILVHGAGEPEQEMGKLRKQVEAAPRQVAVVEATDASYNEAILVLAHYFLEVLDSLKADYPGDSASELGDTLYHACRERLPQTLRDELSGGQVMMAATLAYRAKQGD